MEDGLGGERHAVLAPVRHEPEPAEATIIWLDRKLEGRKIKLGPWKIYKESPFLGGNWILSTRTHGYRLKNVAGNIWVIFCFAAVGLFLAYGFLLAR